MHHAITYLSVAFGGALGAVLRLLISRAMIRLIPDATFPYGTLAANMLGSFLLGMIYVLGRENLLSEPHKLFWTTGMMGALTTFSTFAVEGILLMQAGAWKLALLYWFSSVAMAGILAFLGYQLGLHITGSSLP